MKPCRPIPHTQTPSFKHRTLLNLCLFASLALSTFSIAQEDRIELDTTTIRANKELPKILYVVPWSDTEVANQSQQKLVLHSLYGDFFEPVLPRGNTEMKDNVKTEEK